MNALRLRFWLFTFAAANALPLRLPQWLWMWLLRRTAAAGRALTAARQVRS